MNGKQFDIDAVEYFRITPTTGESRVDRETGIIRDAKIIERGNLNDSRKWFVDDTTMQQTVELGNAPNKGTKARFTHPNMSDDGMGKFLGRWQDFRIDGDHVKADLHLSKTAYDTPDGDLATYVMDLAEEDPEAFGISLAPKLNRKAMEADSREDDYEPIRLHKLHAADVVDSPAATRGGFFALDSTTVDLPTYVTWVIDKHFNGSSYEELSSRLDSYLRRYFLSKGVDPSSGDNHEINQKEADMPLHETIREKCIDAGMDTELSDADAQQWLGENHETVFPAQVTGELLEITTDKTAELLATQLAEVQAKLDAAEAEKAENTDAGQDDAAKLATKRATDILSLCETAHCPDKARGYVSGELSVELVREELFAEVCRKNQRVPDDTDEKTKKTAGDDFEAACREEFDAGDYSSTFEQYFRTRKIDTGRMELKPSTAA